MSAPPPLPPTDYVSAPPRADYAPPPPTAETRMPWPPPPGSQPPPSLPHAGQPPADQLSDTDRMLQPKGLFSGQRPFEPQPWPGSGGSASLFAPPLPAGGPDGMSATMPGGLQSTPQGAEGQWVPGPDGQWAPGDGGPATTEYQPGGPYPPGNQYPQGSPYPPGGPYPPGDPYFPGGPYPPARRPRSRAMTPVIIAAVLVLVVAGVVFLAVRGNKSSGTAGGTTAGPTPTASAPAGAQTQKQAATQLAALLPQSGADHGAVVAAVTDVQSCGQNLANDAGTFSKAASNRQALLSRLGALPGRAALPPAMLTALTSAWKASAQVDTDLATWAQDMAAGCSRHKAANDPNLKASYVPDGQATTGKQEFVRLWNPLAGKYGLKTYQVGDL